MTVAGMKSLGASIALTGLALLVLAGYVAALDGGPPPCEPPAGYVPPQVDVRIVGLMQDQLVQVGSTHNLRAEALDGAGEPWGDRHDWYVDGEHAAEGPEFPWTVEGPAGGRRVTLVVSSGDDAVWDHVDVDAGRAVEGPPVWLGPAMRALPPVSVAIWLLLVRRQMTRRRVPPGGSG